MKTSPVVTRKDNVNGHPFFSFSLLFFPPSLYISSLLFFFSLPSSSSFCLSPCSSPSSLILLFSSLLLPLILDWHTLMTPQFPPNFVFPKDSLLHTSQWYVTEYSIESKGWENPRRGGLCLDLCSELPLSNFHLFWTASFHSGFLGSQSSIRIVMKLLEPCPIHQKSLEDIYTYIYIYIYIYIYVYILSKKNLFIFGYAGSSLRLVCSLVVAHGLQSVRAQ